MAAEQSNTLSYLLYKYPINPIHTISCLFPYTEKQSVFLHRTNNIEKKNSSKTVIFVDVISVT